MYGMCVALQKRGVLNTVKFLASDQDLTLDMKILPTEIVKELEPLQAWQHSLYRVKMVYSPGDRMDQALKRVLEIAAEFKEECDPDARPQPLKKWK